MSKVARTVKEVLDEAHDARPTLLVDVIHGAGKYFEKLALVDRLSRLLLLLLRRSSLLLVVAKSAPSVSSGCVVDFSD